MNTQAWLSGLCMCDGRASRVAEHVCQWICPGVTWCFAVLMIGSALEHGTLVDELHCVDEALASALHVQCLNSSRTVACAHTYMYTQNLIYTSTFYVNFGNSITSHTLMHADARVMLKNWSANDCLSFDEQCLQLECFQLVSRHLWCVFCFIFLLE